MWNNLKLKVLKEEDGNASVLPSMKQITPSDRSDANEGTGDRSEVGQCPQKGHSKIWGNLSSQSKGLDGNIDLQGKSSSEVVNSKKTTLTESKRLLREVACEMSTGTGSEKNKESSSTGKTTGVGHSYKPISEAQVIGSTVAYAAMQIFNESNGFKAPKKRKKR